MNLNDIDTLAARLNNGEEFERIEPSFRVGYPGFIVTTLSGELAYCSSAREAILLSGHADVAG